MFKIASGFFVLCLILFSITACQDSSTSASVDSDPSIATVIEENEEFSFLLSRLNASGVITKLEEEEGPFTIFAPRDGAAQFFIGTNIISLPLSEQRDLMLFHIVEGRIPAESLTDPVRLENLAGRELFASRDSEGELKINFATYIENSFEAPNGIVHKVDRWQVPDEYDIIYFNILKRYFLSDFVDATGQFDDVRTPLANGDRTLTAFVPSNEAFEAAADHLATLTHEQLREVLLYHIVVGRFLSDGTQGEAEIETLREGSNLNIFFDNGNVRINNVSSVTEADIDGINGVFHVIDTVLIPEFD
ncbi:MAG: fasciclin domain-containing protein [Balneolales bacterium]|nr:fasciclin domain-containing protein [Balneolales bacterium]